MSKKLISPILVIALAQFSGSALAARKHKALKQKKVEIYAATETSAADLPIVTADDDSSDETLADLAADDTNDPKPAAPAKEQAGTVAKDEAQAPTPATANSAPAAPAPVAATQAPEQTPDPKLDARVNQLESEMNQIRAQARAEERGEPMPAAAPQAFDTVPAEQKDAIVQRLQIVGDLISKYGRAYDYRTHTLSELKKIEADLEAQAKATPKKS